MVKYFVSLFRVVMQFFYTIIKVFPVKNKVVMISRQSNEPNIDFKLLKDKLDDQYQVVMLCRTLDGGVSAGIFSKFTYFFHMFKQMYHLATSKVVILDTYCILVSLLHHRKSLKVIQIWHSIGTMKKFGYSAVGSKEGSSMALAKMMHMHENYDYVLCSSLKYKEHLAAGFNCDINKIVEYPLPRIDLLTDDNYQKVLKEKIYTEYPQLKDKKNIIYCPTFRKENDQSEKYINELKEYLPSGYNLIIKLHPLSKIQIESNYLYTCDKFQTTELFSIADAVISDYSCVIYEAAILNIPIYFYAYDFDDYIGSRGLAIDYVNELPGIITKSAFIIMDSIKNGNYDFERLNQFCMKYVKNTKHATKDIVDFINSILEDSYE